MSHSLEARILGIIIIIPSLCLGAAAQHSTRYQLPGTPFRVPIPAGWRVEPPTNSSPPKIVHIIEPAYSVSVIFASGKSCARRFKDTESSVSHARTAHPDLPFLASKPRPSFVPLDYADVVQITGNLVSTCLDLGGGGTVVTIIDTKGNSRQLNLVTPILQSIAKSAVPHADIISAPRMAKLPKLRVEIPLRDGQWAVTQMPAIGTQQRDTLVRLKRDVPLEISLAEFAPTAASTCSNLFTDNTDEKPQYAHLKRSPAYLGRRWHPAAWEQSILGQTQFFGCLEVTPKLVVMVQISYGAAELSNADAVSVRFLLDNIAEAIEHGPHTSGQIKTTITDEFLEGFR